MYCASLQYVKMHFLAKMLILTVVKIPENTKSYNIYKCPTHLKCHKKSKVLLLNYCFFKCWIFHLKLMFICILNFSFYSKHFTLLHTCCLNLGALKSFMCLRIVLQWWIFRSKIPKCNVEEPAVTHKLLILKTVNWRSILRQFKQTEIILISWQLK